MRYNLEDIENTDKVYDICIIGTGPAGLVLSSELASTGLSICILESGGINPSHYADNLREVVNEGKMKIKEYSRERIVGGASSTWSGLSALLDPIDMDTRPYLKVPGWPISRDELIPFWTRTKNYNFPDLRAFDEFKKIKSVGQLSPSWNLISEKVFLATVPPQRFVEDIEKISKEKNIDLFYNATALSLSGDSNKKQVNEVITVTPSRKKYNIKSRYFILATGGIENARLLLNSKDICEAGLGNEHDQVGRYFMNHPKENYGYIRLKKPIYEAPYFFGCMNAGFAGFAGLRIKDEIQKELGILNSYVRLEPVYSWSGNKGVESFIFLTKKVITGFKLWRKSGKIVPVRDYSETGDDSPIQNDKKSFKDWAGIGFNIILNFGVIVRYATARVFKNKKVAIKIIKLRNFMEMEPDSNNRISLSDTRDINGSFIPRINYNITDLDRKSLIRLHKILSEELKNSGVGELVSSLENEDNWPVNQDASHHLGTTRMGDDIRSSVVNGDCRLHSINNVYCLGGSVFSTSGCANPTITICALSLRLAEHLKTTVFKLNRAD